MAAAWRHLECDVLVVGAGAAGLRAAIAASGGGMRVRVACKSLLGKAGTVLTTAGEPGAPAARCADSRVAELLAREAPERMKELQCWGALPESPCIGLEVLRTLQHRAVAEPGIEIHMECSIHRLFVAKGRVTGALGLQRSTGELVLFRCNAVVLAAGSAVRAWKRNSGAADATGDSLALALGAGAELADMDLVEFEPDGRCRAGLGGIRVHPDTAQSRVPGVYAAGDAAAGLHGSAGGLSAALVFGRRAGVHAAQHASQYPRMPVSVGQVVEAAKDLLRPFARRSDGESPYAVLDDLQDCMDANVGPTRTVASLAVAREAIEALQDRTERLAVRGPREWNPAWHLALDLRSLLVASERTVLAALKQLSPSQDGREEAGTADLRSTAHG